MLCPQRRCRPATLRCSGSDFGPVGAYRQVRAVEPPLAVTGRHVDGGLTTTAIPLRAGEELERLFQNREVFLRQFIQLVDYLFFQVFSGDVADGTELLFSLCQ